MAFIARPFFIYTFVNFLKAYTNNLINNSLTVPKFNFKSIIRQGGIIMQNTVGLKENRRDEKRFLVFIQARFLMAHSQRYKECVIIDISRTGACAKLPRGEIVTIGGEIFFELPTKELENGTVKGEIVWSKQIENGFIIGVKFKNLLDKKILKI